MLFKVNKSLRLVFCGYLLLLTTNGYAANQDLLNNIGINEVAPIVQSAGIVSQREKTKSGNDYLLVDIKGWQSAIMLLDCKSGSCNMVRFYSGRKAPYVTPSQINTLNKNHRYARIYSSDNNIIIESDLLIQGGVTENSITRFIERQLSTTESIAQGLTDQRPGGAQ